MGITDPKQTLYSNLKRKTYKFDVYNKPPTESAGIQNHYFHQIILKKMYQLFIKILSRHQDTVLVE